MPTSPSSTARSAAAPAAAANKQQNSPTVTRISLLAIPLLAVALAYRRRETGPRVFTKAELARYVDTQNGLKVAICGQVFDVTKGAEFYAKGAGYGFFAGRDASLAFATGNFKTNLTDNVSSLADAQLLELQNWVNETYHKKYVYEGVAAGADGPSACPGLRGPPSSTLSRGDGVPWPFQTSWRLLDGVAKRSPRPSPGRA